jgi:hypothetical protein
MKNTAIAAMIAGAFTAAVVGLAGPAQADVGHHDWAVDSSQHVQVPSVNTTVQQSR